MRRGYTVVELMMALAVLAVSVTGVMAMQKVTAVSNANARDVALANRIAQTWIEQLHADSYLWNSYSPDNITNTLWIKQVTVAGADDFQFPSLAFDATRQIGVAFDGLGRPVDPSGVNSNDTVFCVNFKLTPLTGTTSTRGNIRATVRVYWPRTEVPAAFCNPTAENPRADSSTGVGHPDRLGDFHYVYHTTVIRQHAES